MCIAGALEHNCRVTMREFKLPPRSNRERGAALTAQKSAVLNYCLVSDMKVYNLGGKSRTCGSRPLGAEKKTLISLFQYLYPASFIVYTECPRRNVPDFGRVFLMLKYTDITQNIYVQSWTLTEKMAWEKCGLLAGPRTVPVSWQHYPCQSLSVVSYYGNSAHTRSKLFLYFLLGDKAVHVCSWHSCHV